MTRFQLWLLALSLSLTGASYAAPQQSHRPPANAWGRNSRLRPLAHQVKQAMATDDLATAERLCQRALRIAPHDPVFVDFLDQIRHRQHKKDDEADFQATYKRARALVIAGSYHDATVLCNDYLAAHPGEPSFEELLRDIQARRDSAARNAALLTAIHEVNRLINRHDYDAAAQACNHALDMFPGNLDLLALRRKIDGS